MGSVPCPLCGAFGDVDHINDMLHVVCPRCGRFSADVDGQLGLSDDPIPEGQRGTVSGFVRESVRYRITAETLRHLRGLRPLAVTEKADRLMRLLARQHPHPGEVFHLQCDAPEVLGTCWANDAREVHYLALNCLVDELGALLAPPERHLSNNAMRGLSISPSGWQYVASLGGRNASASRAFVAMWFDPTMDALRDSGLRPAIEAAGYDPVLVSMHEHINRIDDEIIALIRGSRFVVADFTGLRGGVYFEAGFAQGLGLPVVWTCRKDVLASGQLHFDVNHFNFLIWEESSMQSFANALKLRIESVIGHGPRQ